MKICLIVENYFTGSSTARQLHTKAAPFRFNRLNDESLFPDLAISTTSAQCYQRQRYWIG